MIGNSATALYNLSENIEVAGSAGVASLIAFSSIEKTLRFSRLLDADDLEARIRKGLCGRFKKIGSYFNTKSVSGK